MTQLVMKKVKTPDSNSDHLISQIMMRITCWMFYFSARHCRTTQYQLQVFHYQSYRAMVRFSLNALHFQIRDIWLRQWQNNYWNSNGQPPLTNYVSLTLWHSSRCICCQIIVEVWIFQHERQWGSECYPTQTKSNEVLKWFKQEIVFTKYPV
jgi:hypothetical protein